MFDSIGTDLLSQGRQQALGRDYASALRTECVAMAQPYAWDAVLDRILAVYRGVLT